MVCRTTGLGSAATSIARIDSGLEDQQVLSLFHGLVRDGRGLQEGFPHSDAAVAATLSRQAESLRLTPARQSSLADRLVRGRDELNDPGLRYAAWNIRDRASSAARRLGEHRESLAQAMGLDVAEVEHRIRTYRDEAGNDRRLRASREWSERTRATHLGLGIPMDRQTEYAMWRLDQDAATATASAATRPTVTHQRVNSSAIHSVGYDRATNRLEITMHSNPERVYPYQVPAHVVDQMLDPSRTPSIGRFYREHLRGNPSYLYANTETATADGTSRQCPTCGRFAGADHGCPARGSVQERRTMMQAATASTSGTQPPPTYMGRLAYRTDANGVTFRMGSSPLIRDVTQERPVRALFERITPNTNDGDGVQCRVAGYVEVEPAADGARIVHIPDDRDALRCDCAEYRANRTCPHLYNALATIERHLNPAAPDTVRVAAANAAVSTALDEEQRASVAAQQTAQAARETPEVLYEADPAAFQRVYRAAKDRQAAGEEPVPFMRENATGGLGAPGGGRGFGVELEFDVAPGVDRATALAAIGADLHREGLTRDAYQTYFHSAEQRGYSENHQGGWSFEQDCTVAGEIVSPIMYDTPETWENLDKVCAIVKRHGGVATVRAGSHVHVSAHNYDHTVENHTRLARTFTAYQDLIYRLSSNPDRGTHRGSRWCTPITAPAQGYASIADARRVNRQGLNMGHLHGDTTDHVEFRTFDSSLNPGAIQTQIKVSLAVTEAAFRDTDIDPGPAEPLGSHHSHNRSTHGSTRRLTGEAWHQDTASMRRFVDRMFTRTEDKEQATSMFAVTRWARR